MIPKKLRLKNFLSYAESVPELDFDLFRIACLTGENGAGKSSLIESIAWCVWGEGRAKSIELIRKGATEARVEFDFEIDENLYRVIRIAKRKKSGGAETASQQLEFQVYDNLQSNDFRTLTQSTLSETQAKIIQTLGISYETFISASFVVQGRSNAFTMLKPNERKEILVEMLGINRYQRISDLAKQKASVFDKELGATEKRIEFLSERLQTLDALREALRLERERETELSLAVQRVKAQAETIAKQLSVLGEKRVELNAAEQQTATVETELYALSRDTTAIGAEQARLEGLLLRRPAVEARVAEFGAAQQALSATDDTAEAAQRLEKERIQIEATLKQKTAELQTELLGKKRDLDRLAAQQGNKQKLLINAPALDAERTRLLADRTRLTPFAAESERYQSERDTLNEARANLKGEIASHAAECDKITKRGKAVKELKEEFCPLCRSPLDEPHRTQIVEEYRNEYRKYEALKTTAEKSLAELDVKFDAASDAYRDAEKAKAQLTTLERTLAVTEQKQAALASIAEELQSLSAERAAAEAEVQTLSAVQSSGERTAREASRLEELQAELSALGYDAAAHQALRNRVRSLSNAPAELATLSGAEENLKSLAERLTAIDEKRAALQSRLTELKFVVAALLAALEPEAALKADAQTHRRDEAETERALRESIDRRSKLAYEVAELERQQAEIDALRLKTADARDSQFIYSSLQEAFGIKGIQSLLIGHALPQLELEANLLLQKITRNQASLIIEPLREQQNQKVVETFDIKISDAQGTVRDYATFSGGEKFRVDFALRIALSKLLAAQVGKAIKVLIIDEGFGTQDDEGVEAMIEAIHSISSEFEKIILITHLEKMREAFDVRIFVTRDAQQGSRFELTGVS